MQAAELISLLRLEPFPEDGGWFRQTYKSVKTLPGRFVSPEKDGVRSFATSIYYLVTPESYSALHRVSSDEIFHFYMGDPVEMIQIPPDGKLGRFTLGPDLRAGQEPQLAVAAGVWQGTRLLDGGKWALLGCTVAPGFEFIDFELGKRDALQRQFPKCAAEIERFTRA